MPQPLMLKKMKLTILWRPTAPLRTNFRKKKIIFIIGDWNAKVGSQEIPGVSGKFGLGVQNEAGQRITVLPREDTGHSKNPLPTTQEVTLHMDITRWSIPKPDWFYSLKPKMEKNIQPVERKSGDNCSQIMNSWSLWKLQNWRK